MTEFDIKEENVPEGVDEIVPQDPDTDRHPPVSTVIEGPVRVQQLPSRSGVPRTLTLTTTPEPIAGNDLRRRIIRLLVPSIIVAEAETNNSVRIAQSKQGVTDGSGFLLSVGVVLELTHADAVYAASTTGSATLSVMTENWAD